MGIIARLFDFIFGDGRNVLRDTAEVFRENAEAEAQRDHALRAEAMEQFGGEFLPGRRGRFDRVMDALNRLPRPMMALGCLGLFVSAMVDPVWFAARMKGVALVPEPLWWLLGVVVSFYFGARHQMKGQEFQKAMAASLSLIAQSSRQDVVLKSEPADRNEALEAWRAERTG